MSINPINPGRVNQVTRPDSDTAHQAPNANQDSASQYASLEAQRQSIRGGAANNDSLSQSNQSGLDNSQTEIRSIRAEIEGVYRAMDDDTYRQGSLYEMSIRSKQAAVTFGQNAEREDAVASEHEGNANQFRTEVYNPFDPGRIDREEQLAEEARQRAEDFRRQAQEQLDLADQDMETFQQLEIHRQQLAQSIAPLQQRLSQVQGSSGASNNNSPQDTFVVSGATGQSIQIENPLIDIGSTDGSGGGNDQNQDGNNQTSIFIQIAKTILSQVSGLIKPGGIGEFARPIEMIAKYLQGLTLTQLAKSYAEAGMTDEVTNQSAMLKHEALEVDQRAAGLTGEFTTDLQAWKDVLAQNKTAEKNGEAGDFRHA